MITRPGHDQNCPNHSCWNKDYQVQALRVELADGNVYVFPYRRFAFARFESGIGRDTLQVVLDTHEIQITGKHLRGIAVAFQKFAVDWLRELPDRYVSQVDDGQAWVTGITVTEAQH